MKVVRLVDTLLVRIETMLLIFSLSLMVIFAFGQVLLRNVFDTGFLWGDPLVRQMVLWSGFLGAGLAAHEDRHISIDAFTKFFSARSQLIIKVVTQLAAAVIAYFLLDAALEFLLEEKEAGGEIFLGIPSWVGLLILPVGYGLMMVHFLLTAIEKGVERFRPAGAGQAEKG